MAGVRVIFIPHTQSKGVGMARALADSLWQGEEYVLQLDAHHRFMESWDERAIEDLAKCAHPKPLLTGYLPNYQPPHDKKKFTQTELMIRTKEPVIRFGSKSVAPGRDVPYPGRLMSAHFVFSRSERLQECRNDSWVYMNGEEAHMSIKLLLAGWQPFSLYRPIAWHQYGRRAHHHWQDNKGWGDLNRLSIDRIWGEIREYKNLIGAEDFC
ncbi:MAG: hypothetical protein HC773_05635 [Scytonema sp. CRU_2_7]|nr:hypothetical protein [Scytonema sp. CRU_2_7]